MPYIRTPKTIIKRNTVTDPENLGAKSGPANTAGSRGGGRGGGTTRTGTPRTSTNTKPVSRRTSPGKRMTPKKTDERIGMADMMSEQYDTDFSSSYTRRMSKKNENPMARTKAGRNLSKTKKR